MPHLDAVSRSPDDHGDRDCCEQHHEPHGVDLSVGL